MRILYFFAEIETPMFQWQRTHIIDELSHHSIEVITFNPLDYATPDEANEEVVKEAKKGQYDLFLSSICYHKFLYVQTVDEIKKLGLPTFAIIWDNLMVPYLNKVLASHFDLLWLTSKETERLYKKWGAKYFFAPYAANPFTFTYNKAPIVRSACFIGNPHGSRSIMINTLTANHVPVDLFCGGSNMSKPAMSIHPRFEMINPTTRETIMNRFKFAEGRKLIMGSIKNKLIGATSLDDNDYLHKHNGLSHVDMVDTYSKTALSLASTSAGHTDVLKHPLPIINLRNFEIPMCGGIEVCKYNDELADYFEEGKEIVFYRTDEDLVERARYYTQKATDGELYAIKEAARKRAESDHTWWNRFKLAFDSLSLKFCS